MGCVGGGLIVGCVGGEVPMMWVDLSTLRDSDDDVDSRSPALYIFYRNIFSLLSKCKMFVF